MKIFLIILAFLTVSCKKEETQVVRKPVEVAVTVAKKTPLNIKKESTGFIKATEKVDIRARVGGFLKAKLFTDGQNVKAGDTLFIIEPDEYQATVNAAKADLDMALAEEAKDKLQYNRSEKLIKSKTITQSTFDEQKAAYGVAKAQVGQAKAKLQQAELSLGYTTVKSPIDGVVADNNFDVGNYVSLESSALTSVVKSDPVEVNFTISEKFLFKIIKQMKSAENITKYMQAALILPNGEEYENKGKITFVDTTIDLTTNTLRLKAVFDNKDGILKDGQYAKINIETIEPVPSFVIPQSLLLVDQLGRYVFVVDKEGKVKTKRIETSGDYGDKVLVLKGIDEGDKIITGGYQSLRTGMSVNFKEVKEDVSPVPNKDEPEKGANTSSTNKEGK